MAILGVDYGSKRIGLAICTDSLHASRLDVIENKGDVAKQIDEICRKHEITVIVVGLPRNLDGDDTPQTKLVRQFVTQLEENSPHSVVLQDEADTTNMARRRLKEQKYNETETDKLVDAEAAVIILEDYLHEQ